MDNAVKKYKKRRQKRLDGRTTTKVDDVQLYRERRDSRLSTRMDANIGWAYGLAKSKGIDTVGMTPREVFEALEERGTKSAKTHADAKFEENEHPRDESGRFTSGGSSGKAPKRRGTKDTATTSTGKKPSGGWEAKAKATKGVEIEDGVPVFDKNTFTEDFEAKKEIAREAAIERVPIVKKRLSTEIKPIERPKVTEGTKKYIREQVPKATEEQIDQALKEAAKIYAYWEEREAPITKTVVDAVKSIGGTMDGLDNRLKFDQSLAKKAVADAQDPQFKGDVSKAAKGIKDGARYTAVFDNDTFAEGYQKVKEALGKMGIKEYRCKNFFTQYRDQDGTGKKKIGEQKSIQCVFETEDGGKFELQFHTPESLAAKDVNHHTYKQKKEPPQGNEAWNDPRSWLMRDTSSVVPDPKGVFDIEEHKRGESGYK